MQISLIWGNFSAGFMYSELFRLAYTSAGFCTLGFINIW